MTDQQFRTALDKHMEACVQATQEAIPEGQDAGDEATRLLNGEAKSRGFDDWQKAFWEFALPEAES